MKNLAATLVGLALLTGCAVGPNYKQPTVSIPVEYREVQGPPAPAPSLADLPWWTVFGDEKLQALIDEALGKGFDVQIAALRVEEARARAGIARSEYWPQIGYGAQWSRSQQSTFVPPFNHGTYNFHDVNVNFGWELDLWGRIRRLNEEAKAQYLATEEARRGVLLSLVSDVARAYFQILELDQELKIAKDTAKAFGETAELYDRKLQEGAASAVQTAYARAAYKQVSSQVPELERAIEATEDQLNLLLGRSPAPIPRGATLLNQHVPPQVPAGLPSTLLERRPDVRQAEQELIAANARVGVATANFFPTISLTGLLGGVSPQVSNLFPAGRTWSIAAGLFGPLFQGGRLRSEYDVAYAQWQQSVVLYERTVTGAFADTTAVLYAREKIASSVTQIEEAVKDYREMVRLTTLRYDSGLSSYFEVLYAMQQLYPAELALARGRSNQLTNLVDIYKALGGGWNLQPEDPNPTWLSPAAAPAATPASAPKK